MMVALAEFPLPRARGRWPNFVSCRRSSEELLAPFVSPPPHPFFLWPLCVITALARSFSTVVGLGSGRLVALALRDARRARGGGGGPPESGRLPLLPRQPHDLPPPPRLNPGRREGDLPANRGAAGTLRPARARRGKPPLLFSHLCLQVRHHPLRSGAAVKRCTRFGYVPRSCFFFFFSKEPNKGRVTF